MLQYEFMHFTCVFGGQHNKEQTIIRNASSSTYLIQRTEISELI